MICDLKTRKREGSEYIDIQMSKNEALKLLSDIDEYKEVVDYIESLSLNNPVIGAEPFINTKIKELGNLLKNILRKD